MFLQSIQRHSANNEKPASTASQYPRFILEEAWAWILLILYKVLSTSGGGTGKPLLPERAWLELLSKLKLIGRGIRLFMRLRSV